MKNWSDSAAGMFGWLVAVGVICLGFLVLQIVQALRLRGEQGEKKSRLARLVRFIFSLFSVATACLLAAAFALNAKDGALFGDCSNLFDAAHTLLALLAFVSFLHLFLQHRAFVRGPGNKLGKLEWAVGASSVAIMCGWFVADRFLGEGTGDWEGTGSLGYFALDGSCTPFFSQNPTIILAAGFLLLSIGYLVLFALPIKRGQAFDPAAAKKCLLWSASLLLLLNGAWAFALIDRVAELQEARWLPPVAGLWLVVGNFNMHRVAAALDQAGGAGSEVAAGERKLQRRVVHAKPAADKGKNDKKIDKSKSGEGATKKAKKSKSSMTRIVVAEKTSRGMGAPAAAAAVVTGKTDELTSIVPGGSGGSGGGDAGPSKTFATNAVEAQPAAADGRWETGPSAQGSDNDNTKTQWSEPPGLKGGAGGGGGIEGEGEEVAGEAPRASRSSRVQERSSFKDVDRKGGSLMKLKERRGSHSSQMTEHSTTRPSTPRPEDEVQFTRPSLAAKARIEQLNAATVAALTPLVEDIDD